MLKNEYMVMYYCPTINEFLSSQSNLFVLKFGLGFDIFFRFTNSEYKPVFSL